MPFIICEEPAAALAPAGGVFYAEPMILRMEADAFR